MLIDDKGRLFGIINIIDLLAVIFILLLLLGLWPAYKIFKRPIEIEPLINWEQRYNNEISKQEVVFKEHPRLRKYFK